MVGVELAVGYLFGWAVRKARRVAGRADAEVDQALEAGMDRLHGLITARLGQDPALERAREEAESGREELSERTRRRLVDSLEDVAERDPAFAKALEELMSKLQAVVADGGVSAAVDGQAIGGNVDVHAEGGSVAALKTGDVTIGRAGNPSLPGPD